MIINIKNQKPKIKNYKHNGQIMIAVLVICSVILAWILILSTLITNDARYQSDMGNSSIAYYAAESGVEEVMLSGMNIDDYTLPNPRNIGNATYKYSIKLEGDVAIIISSGTMKNVTRTIKVIVPKKQAGETYYKPSSWEEISPISNP